MPEHANSEAMLRILEPFDSSVLRPRDLAQPFADPHDALVMARLRRRAVAEQRSELRPELDPHGMIREGALHLAMLLVADDLRQVLHEVAAAGNVQHLDPAAHREHWHVARK